MSDPVAKQRSSIDFDKFERTIHDNAVPSRRASAGQEDDPLAELARLVGSHPDPYGDVFAQDAPASVPTGVSSRPAPRQPSLDFAAIEAGLRGPISAHEVAAPDLGHGAYVPEHEAFYDQQGQGVDPSWYEPAQPEVAPTRSRRPVFMMVAVIAAGVAGIGIAFAYKGSSSGPREIAMIKAAPGPTKIQPPADDAGGNPTQDASILDKGQQPAPKKLVSREEQPVDLAQTVQNAPRDVGSGVTTLYNFGSAADASRIPVPTPPGLAPAESRPRSSGIANDIEPIRVKTRSYRPDGTPIPDDQPPAAAVSAAPPVVAKADKAPVAKTSTPKAVTPKSTTRVATTPKPIVTADVGEAASPSEPKAAADPLPRKAKPAKPVAKPVQTATATDEADDAAAAPVSSGGGFAVQLAAPGSEAEAKQMSTRLSQKFSSELGGRKLSFHKADSNGHSVYRVRVSSLSREEATGMCEKLKSNGGTCFVAKN